MKGIIRYVENMSYYTYILKSEKTGKFYVGSSQDVVVRLGQHNSGKTKSTKGGIPWQIVKAEIFSSRSEACAREKQIKSYKGGNAFKKLVGLI